MFLPPNSLVLLEAPLNAVDRKMPHGNIDLVIVTPGVDAITTSYIGVMIVDGESSQLKLATSMKNESTIRSIQSRKHVYIHVDVSAHTLFDSMKSDCI